MAGRLIVPPGAVAAQRRSSDPAASVWVSANAGAGKTYVLAQRVIRLLLAGAAPGSILCLTYTNAAAAEMAQRVFDSLARLATLAPADLSAQIAVLAPGADPLAAARRARTLFAETLETPGGLKVQTLHAFAAALLRRFPLEAGVTGAFAVLDEGMRAELTERAIATTLARAAADPAGETAHDVAALTRHLSDHSLAAVLGAALAEPQALKTFAQGGIEAARLAADLSEALALAEVEGGPPAIGAAQAREIVAAMRENGGDVAVADKLEASLAFNSEEARDAIYTELFLNKDSKPRKQGGAVSAALRAALPWFDERLKQEQDRLVVKAERDRIAATIEATVPLLRLAVDALSHLDDEKQRRGAIDYDDQIERAAALVKDASAAAWVRYKLDEGIDHVLLDEAQDTAPAQWDLIDALTDEFYAGRGAREGRRTLFVVGDKKQSIYSFQGAAPDLFVAKHSQYAAAAAGVGQTFAAVDLSHSFRSARQVLSAVDAVFAADAMAGSVGAGASAVRHEAVRQEAGGVDVWPLFKDAEVARPDDWDKPFDYAPDSAGEVQLVRAIADQIEAWCGTEGPLGGPPIGPGEVMILTRSRGTFAARMNRELKARKIPAAGADRLDVTSHIAVKDMMALGRALISRDDLSLAAVLRSPLFGFSDEALFALAHAREGSLLAALREGDAAARQAHDTLWRWRRRAREVRPFDLFAGILIGEGRRADFAARMGSEAEDALDAFLDLALDLEATGVPALEPFLYRLARTSTELRRTADTSGDKVRVMTVHGAKGLEAKVVFLCDVGTKATKDPTSPELVALPLGQEDTALALAQGSAKRPERVKAVFKERKARETDEHRRLLYVGMTRAERHLVVCGAYRKREPHAGMWHALVEGALRPHAEPLAMPHGTGLAWRHPAAKAPAWPAAPIRTEVPPTPPEWLTRPAVLIAGAPEPIIASGGHAGPGEAFQEDRVLRAAEHGTLVHALLEQEFLSEAAMRDHVARVQPQLGATEIARIVQEAQAAQALSPDEDGRVYREVAVMGDVTLPDGQVRRASGRIDRLNVGAARIEIIDYKTDRSLPSKPQDVPQGYKLQLAIYRALVAAIAPGKRIEATIIWTTGPTAMAVGPHLPTVTALGSAAAA